MGEIRVIRPEAEASERQRLAYFLGVSRDSCGSTGLAMHLVVVPPGAAAEPHSHEGYETAIYQLEGRVETRYGEGLGQSVVSEAGDFLFIPAGVPHQPVNLSATERAVALVARNDADEHERVVPYEA
ncbi:MAG TPA: cupin domain-containing protein [Gaiellaceae bacterium]